MNDLSSPSVEIVSGALLQSAEDDKLADQVVNSVAFNQMKDPAKDFAHIRLWGTVGWIIAGWLISLLFKWDAPATISDGLLANTKRDQKQIKTKFH